MSMTRKARKAAMAAQRKQEAERSSAVATQQNAESQPTKEAVEAFARKAATALFESEIAAISASAEKYMAMKMIFD